MERIPIARWLPQLVATAVVLCGLLVGALIHLYADLSAQAARPHVVISRPEYVYAGAVNGDRTFPCQTTRPATCFGPQQIQAAYGITPVLEKGITGKGHTIVIIDAYQSPTIRHDLRTFDALFGLKNPPAFTIVAPEGLPPFDPFDSTQVGWAAEISLDVEWAHAIAPEAAITLVLAKSNQDVDVLNATRYAIEHNLGDIISQSFGEGESCVDPTLLKQEHELFAKAVAQGMTLFAASGDQGAAQPGCDGNSYFLSVSSPASDPLVTSVGGTLLSADGTTGRYEGEEGWNEPQYEAASGGGFSTIYPRSDYQNGIEQLGNYRGVPDVAFNAGIDSGVLVVWSSSGEGQDLVFRFGGTSAGAPQWSGIAALADQLAGHRLGNLNPALYAIGRSNLYTRAFHDITEGDNTFVGQDVQGDVVAIQGYSAGPGWDPVTGLGTPRVEQLLPLLIQPPSSTALHPLYPLAPGSR
jgi:subtilase family serine protease